MSKRAKKTDTLIDGTKYKQIEDTNRGDTHWMNIPQVKDKVPASGLHIINKARQRSHWDKFEGKKKLNKKEYLEGPPKIKSFKIDLENHGIFPAPPDNQILVLRGSDKMAEWVSLEYYKKNKDKYLIIKGDETNPILLELKDI